MVGKNQKYLSNHPAMLLSKDRGVLDYCESWRNLIQLFKIRHWRISLIILHHILRAWFFKSIFLPNISLESEFLVGFCQLSWRRERGRRFFYPRTFYRGKKAFFTTDAKAPISFDDPTSGDYFSAADPRFCFFPGIFAWSTDFIVFAERVHIPPLSLNSTQLKTHRGILRMR